MKYKRSLIFGSAACADPESFVRRGQFFTFLVDTGREDPSTTISGPSSARQRNAILIAFCWRGDDGTALNAGLVALLGDPDQHC